MARSFCCNQIACAGTTEFSFARIGVRGLFPPDFDLVARESTRTCIMISASAGRSVSLRSGHNRMLTNQTL